MTLLIIALIALTATFLGGLFALRNQDKLHLILSYSAGAVIGVAFFELMPESIELAGDRFGVSAVTSLIALGFIVYTVLSHNFTNHFSADELRRGKAKGRFGAGSLSVHSFLDGLGIGFAFQVNFEVGLVVALGVIVHDFADGLNTVTMILKNGGTRVEALKWLIVDALAPTLGIVIASFVRVGDTTLGLILAMFAGFFFFIGASELLPESHHRHPKLGGSILTVVGLATVYIAIRLAGS